MSNREWPAGMSNRAFYDWLRAANPYLPARHHLDEDTELALTMATNAVSVLTIPLYIAIPGLPTIDEPDLGERKLVELLALNVYETFREANDFLPDPQYVTQQGFTVHMHPNKAPVLTIEVIVAVPLTRTNNQGDQIT